MTTLPGILEEAKTRHASEIVLESGQPVVVTTPQGGDSFGSEISESSLFELLTEVLSQEQQVELMVGNAVELTYDEWSLITEPGPQGISVRGLRSQQGGEDVQGASASDPAPAAYAGPSLRDTSREGNKPDVRATARLDPADAGPPAHLLSQRGGDSLPVLADEERTTPSTRSDLPAQNGRGEEPPMPPAGGFDDPFDAPLGSSSSNLRIEPELEEPGDIEIPIEPSIELPNLDEGLLEPVDREARLEDEETSFEFRSVSADESQVPYDEATRSPERTEKTPTGRTRMLHAAPPPPSAVAPRPPLVGGTRLEQPAVPVAAGEVGSRLAAPSVCFVEPSSHFVDVVAQQLDLEALVLTEASAATVANRVREADRPGVLVVRAEDPSAVLGFLLRRLEEGWQVIVETRCQTGAGARRTLLGVSHGAAAERWLDAHPVYWVQSGASAEVWALGPA